jgi:tRNA-modifying protein YgfZ
VTTAASTAARQGVLVVQQPLATLVLTGADRREWLNGLVTCDVKAVEPGTGAWGLLLTKQGKIVADVSVVAGGDAFYLGVEQRAADTLFETLSQFLIMEDAELRAPSTEFGWLTLHGPRALELAKAIAPAGGAWGAIDWTGLGGAAVVAPAGEVQAMLGAAKAYRDAEVVLGSGPDWEQLRIERGVPVHGTDYDDRDNPHDASLERRAVSWTKGCYLGQEVVCMQDMRGKLKRRVVTLALDSRDPPAPGAGVEVDGQNVGEVTSSAFSEVLQKSVLLVRITARALESGGALRVAGQPAERLEPAP